MDANTAVRRPANVGAALEVVAAVVVVAVDAHVAHSKMKHNTPGYDDRTSNSSGSSSNSSSPLGTQVVRPPPSRTHTD